MEPTFAPASRAARVIVSLQEVTAQSVRAVTDLRVSPQQQAYVASNAVSIAQAYFHPEAWFRAICVDDVAVGFVMLEDPTLLPDWLGPAQVRLWRFMIDERYQGRGYGRAGMRLVVEQARSRPGQSMLRTSCVPGPHSPVGFYERCGFRRTGEIDDGEEVLELSLGQAYLHR
ncbi:MAG: GNAT family N-acetyltransferase [Burkholderiaceae bacterium]